ncbi:hypothetical protein KC866_00790 [Patescibacteria group bacterium]|nr:hypothetical protein [Patescibacteria group bacterium]
MDIESFRKIENTPITLSQEENDQIQEGMQERRYKLRKDLSDEQLAFLKKFYTILNKLNHEDKKLENRESVGIPDMQRRALKENIEVLEEEFDNVYALLKEDPDLVAYIENDIQLRELEEPENPQLN